MRKMKRAFFREEGSSMILVLIYLLVCLLLAGTVLSAAGANRARAADMMHKRQEFLLDRSSMGTLADLLEDTPPLTIRDMTWEGGRRVTFHIPEDWAEPSCLQTLLYAHAANQYVLAEHLSPEQLRYENLPSDTLSAAPETEGTVELLLEYSREGEGASTGVRAEYYLSGTGDLTISLPGMTLKTVCRRAPGTPVTVTLEDETARTVTTVFSWDMPILEKGEGQ